MKKQIIAGLIVLIIAGCSVQLKPVCDYDEGIYKEYYKNGQIKSECLCKDRELNGRSRFFYESGELKRESHYIHGALEGESKSYYKNGVLKSRENFKNGKLDGLATYYQRDGSFDRFIHYKDGKTQQRKLKSTPGYLPPIY